VLLNQEFIHFDLKPDNIMMDSDDGKVTILDFAGAKVSQVKLGSYMTPYYEHSKCTTWKKNDKKKIAPDFDEAMQCVINYLL
jgi:serine/threonine protein kinase